MALGLGGIFLVRYSIEAGLLGPAMRVFLGLVFSGLLLAGGEWLRRSGFAEADGPTRRAYVPGVLAAAGDTSGDCANGGVITRRSMDSNVKARFGSASSIWSSAVVAPAE